MLKILRRSFVICGLLMLVAMPAWSGTDTDKVIYEFFSFSCPHCYKHDALFSQWGKTLPSPLSFQSVPIVTNSKWQIQTARAYYAALRVDRVKAKLMKMKLFDLVMAHPANINMDADNTYFALAKKLGIKENDFRAAWWSDEVKSDVTTAYNLFMEFRITNIPCLVIGGKALNPDMVAGGKDYQRFFQLANGYASRILDGTINKITQANGR